MSQVIGWFSAGVTSTVALKIAIDDGLNVVPIYFETGSAHPDNARFIKDCEVWYGQKIIIFQHSKHSSVLDLLRKITYVNGPNGAECTRTLKKDVRIAIEKWMPYSAQIFGFEFEPKQVKRAERFTEQYPDSKAIFPLIEERVTKLDSIAILKREGIQLPTMYRMGYLNNNCIGCVKGGMGYWNKIRQDWPEVFSEMAVLERQKGHSCIKGVFLDELDPERGHYPKELTPECGVICEPEMMV